MATLKVNTLSGIGTEGPVLDGGLKFRSLNYLTLPKGDTTQRGRGRGVVGGGYIAPARSDVIDYITIQSEGGAKDFGDLTEARSDCANVSSSTRGLWAGGIVGFRNIIDFVTIATTGNAADFGDITSQRQSPAGASNQTRGIVAGGKSPSSNPAGVNTIEFITIASTGDGQDFGDLLATQAGHFGLSSPTRAIFAGGYTPADTNVIQYITIATTGNAQDFGDAPFLRSEANCASSATRGVCMGGVQPSPEASTTNIFFITIASTGNGTEFGDLTASRQHACGLGDTIRAVCAGGVGSPAINTIDFINISTGGQAMDFGDTTQVGWNHDGGGVSNGHGGLG